MPGRLVKKPQQYTISNIQHITNFYYQALSSAGKPIQINGFGKSQLLWLRGASAEEFPEYLQTGRLTVLSPSDCRKIHNIQGDQICSVSANKNIQTGSCKGDSGGGLVSQASGRYVILGAVSGGARNCSDGTPGLYTNILSHMDWITQIVGPSTQDGICQGKQIAALLQPLCYSCFITGAL